MRIGIDVSPIVYGTGVSIYTKNLVENLLQIDKQNQYKLFFSSLRQKFPGLNQANYQLKQTKLPPTLLDILWNQFHIIPIETFIGQLDIFHCSDWTQPPTQKTPTVTTIHDLSFLRWPESAHPKVLKAQKRRLKWVKKEADHIVAVSKATKKEIIDLLDIPENKVTVIYEGLPEDVKEFPSYELRVASLKEKYNIGDKYIMAMGSQAPRKNIKRLIKSYELLVKNYKFEKFNLVIAGKYKTREQLPSGVITTGFLNREELLHIFSQALALIYPSIYEGFGIPILEAFALDVPVVTSNCSSMVEIADNAALLVEPKSVKSITAGIRKVLIDQKKRKELISKGRQRLKDFSWRKTAQQTLEVYNQVLK